MEFSKQNLIQLTKRIVRLAAVVGLSVWFVHWSHQLQLDPIVLPAALLWLWQSYKSDEAHAQVRALEKNVDALREELLGRALIKNDLGILLGAKFR